MKTPESSRHRNVLWGDLPHARLSSEVAQRIAYRSPHEAHYELQLQELATRLPEGHRSDHSEYSRLVSAEINRKLRICRDVYREYLATLNNKSRTAKWSVALDLAIAPAASQILRSEIGAYLRDTKIEPWIVEIFLKQGTRMVMVPLGDGEVRTLASRELSREEVIRSVVPDEAFQYVKRRFTRESFIVGGPFAPPHVLRCALSYRVSGDELSMLYEANEIWISQAGRMWDNVLHEIVSQRVQIDLEERSDAMAALGTLSSFESHAGVLYSEARDRYTTIPDTEWTRIGEIIDALGIPLEDNLEGAGRDVLRKLAQNGIAITSWSAALVSKSYFDFLPVKDVKENNRVKFLGNLSRHTKRAFYRAAESYAQVLERVYERRMLPSKALRKLGTRGSSSDR